jgi:hypothetical protein
MAAGDMFVVRSTLTPGGLQGFFSGAERIFLWWAHRRSIEDRRLGKPGERD